MKPFKQPVSALIVIHTGALDILLIERAAHPGYWQSVTGSREGDEPIAATASREVEEETGIVVAPHVLTDWATHVDFEIFPQWRQRYAPGTTHNREHIFSLQVPADTPIRLAPGEHRAWRWVPWQQAAEAVFSWSNRDAIQTLARRFARQ